jgi:hypothetical protein
MPDAGESQPPGAWLPLERLGLGFGSRAYEVGFPHFTEAALAEAACLEGAAFAIGAGAAAVTLVHNFLGRALGQDSIGNRDE